MNTENIKIGNIYIEDINCKFFKKFIILVVMSIAIYVLLAKIDPIFAILSLIPIAPICFLLYFMNILMTMVVLTSLYVFCILPQMLILMI